MNFFVAIPLVLLFDFLCRDREFLVTTEFTSTSCFVCHDRNNLFRDKVLLLFVVNSECDVEIDFPCHDRNASLSWSHVENFVATKQHLSKLTCVISLPFFVAIEMSFVVTEFIC